MSDMTLPDPETDRRFHELSDEAHRIGENPNPGEAEVRRLSEVVTEMQEIVSGLPQRPEYSEDGQWMRLTPGGQWRRAPRGRAVDLPPTAVPGKRGKPAGLPPVVDGQGNSHIHWA